MQEANFIVRDPLLNSQGRVLGYALTWQRNELDADRLDEMDAKALLALVTGQTNETADEQSAHGDYVLFMEAQPALLKADAYSRLPKQRTVLTLNADDLADDEAVAMARALRVRGYGISLRGANLAEMDRNRLSLFSHIEVSVDAVNFPAQVEFYRNLGQSLRMVVRDISNWTQYDSCASQGMDAFVGDLHLTPRPGERVKELNPTQNMIVQLMEMVKQGEDVRQLESVLKRDAALAYKLLRYINSAGFGLGCEIQSLRHAVTLLGYSPLYRWLALLLVTATNTESSQVLLQTAVIRGRFAELLGHTFLPRHEAENLFVAGMFSLLDRLLGIPMEYVLEKIPLSGPVSEALLSREGIYGPFLALAEACELNSTEAESMATSLCISPKDVNLAHLSALAWVQNLRL
jgi:c-di-GMP-related signal transduction protein